MDTEPKKVTIVGGGVCGALLTAHLLQSRGPVRVDLIEPRPEVGLGLAYSTPNTAHLMNVRAGGLSLLPDQPLHFVEWLRKEYNPAPAPHEFVPRPDFGRYVREFLAERIAAAEEGVTLVQHRARALALDTSSGKPVVTLDNGTQVQTDCVVVATGNLPPPAPRVLDPLEGATGYFPSAWTPGALTASANEGDALVIGAGLTAVDAVLTLTEGSWKGTVHVVSRHGWWSQRHSDPFPVPPPPSLDELPRTSRTLLRWVRSAIQAAAARGDDWRTVIDSLRPVTNPLWMSLGVDEKRRFQRHLRSLWDIHRHRMAPSAGERLAALTAEGRLRTIAARVHTIARHPEGFAVTLRRRGSKEEEPLLVSRVITCAGIVGGYTALSDPFLGSLFERELVSSEPLGQGLAVAPDGELLRPDGVPSGFLYAIGPPRSGTLQETVAIPELRVQALALANHLRSRYEL